jgi:hypothetical protein
MNKTWQLRAWAFYLCLGAPIATSCAKEANTLEGGDDGPGGSSSTAGTAGKGGSGNKAGSSASFGGTAGMPAGGKPSGGMTGEAGEPAAVGGDGTTAGTGGTGGAGGTGGTATVPPDVLERASAIVHYQCEQKTTPTGQISMKLFIQNQSSDSLPMANVKIRYWFTAELPPTLHQYYVHSSLKGPKATFVDAADESHVLMTFTGGSVAKGTSLNDTEVQLAIANNTPGFDQTDDFSFDATATTSKPNGKVTLYLDDKLIWGCEPSGVCFDDDDGAGGAGGVGAGGVGAGGEPSGPMAGAAGAE